MTTKVLKFFLLLLFFYSIKVKNDISFKLLEYISEYIECPFISVIVGQNLNSRSNSFL